MNNIADLKTFSYHINDISAAAQFVLENVGNAKVICFIAEMGAGKTTLIKNICQLLHVEHVISSPTFSIINTYHTTDNNVVYHLDLYRINDTEELLQAGVEDVLYSNQYCFVEWPQVAEMILPEDAILVEIEITGELERTVTVKNYFN